MPTILVKSAGRPFRCEITGHGECKYCAQPVVWARTARGKAIPLEPFSETATSTQAHFKHCGRQIGSEPPPRSDYRYRAPGVEMSETVWRKLMQLVHPDRHNDSLDEQLAAEMTRWLLEQRSRLVGKEGGR
jgi:hypothetical protein